MKHKSLTICVLLCTLLFISLLPPTVAENDNDLSIREGESYRWKITSFDIDGYYEMAGMYGAYYFYEGGIIIITIEEIHELDDQWQVESEQMIYKNNPNKKPSEINLKIPDKEEKFSSFSYYSFIDNAFIKNDAEDFLEDLEDYFDNDSFYNQYYSVDDLEIKYENDADDYEIVHEYTADGILQTRTIEYDGDVIFQMVLETNAISSGPYFLGFLSIAVLGILFITVRKLKMRCLS